MSGRAERPTSLRGVGVGVLVAVAACGVATGLCLAASLEGKPGPGAIFLVAVCVSAYFGGVWSGLLAAALSYGAATWFFVEPTHTFKLDTDVVAFVTALVLASLAILALLGREQRAKLRVAGALAEEQRLREDLQASSALLRESDERRRFVAGWTEALTSTLVYEETLARIPELAVPAIADYCRVDVLDDVELIGSGIDPAAAAPTERGRLAPRTAASLHASVDVADVLASGRGQLHPRLGEEPASALVAPMSLGDRKLGAITLVRTDGDRAYGADELAFAEELARRAAVALDNALLHRIAETARARAEAAAKRMRRLQTILDATFSSGSVDELVHEVLVRVREAVGSDTATILTVGEGDTLVVRRSIGLSAPVQGLPLGQGVAGRAAATRLHQVVHELGSERGDGHLVASGIVSAVGVPLIADGSLVGVLEVGWRQPRDVDEEEDLMLLRLVATRAAISIDRAAAHEREHAVAAALQRSLLPARLPTIEGVETAGRYLPGTRGLEVGGDWYDVFELADGSVGLAVGDVRGRGVTAAATMGHLRGVLRAYASEGLGPGETLARLNGIAAENELFATVVCAVVSKSRSSVRIANAGHPPPLLRAPDGSVRRLDEVLSPPLGAVDGSSFVEAELQLDPDSSLVLYTDGLVERRGESIDRGIDRLSALVATAAAPAQRLVDGILEALDVDGHPDDRALLAVHVPRSTVPRMAMRFPPDPSALAAARDALRDWLRRHRADDEEIFDIVFAVGEACSNAIEHPLDVRDAEIGLEAQIADGRVAIVINDSGRWKAETSSSDRGLGLKFMHAMMEKVEVVRSSDGTSVRLERALAGASTRSAASR
jgi:serine phosphatase RsbU (regulator of sigma subunit)/anti-sigma regulatory factor (Ser/Thr protein kinase)